MTHIEALELDRVPKHLLVLGGGYVGLEMAQALRRFGSRVTVIERNDALAHREDRDVSEALRELFDDEGIEVLTATHRRARGGAIRRVRKAACDARHDRGIGPLGCERPAPRTPTASAWRPPGSNGTTGASSRSMNGCGRRPPACGQWAISPAAPISHISPTTMSA